MGNLNILNTKEVKPILSNLEECYGCDLSHLKHSYAFLMNAKSHVHLITRDLDKINFTKLRINSMGLYFAEIMKGGEVRLTVEGSHLVGPLAMQNVADLSSDNVREYFNSKPVRVKLNVKGQPYVILRYGTDYFGAAKYKNGTILNFLPKVHRTPDLIL